MHVFVLKKQNEYINHAVNLVKATKNLPKKIQNSNHSAPFWQKRVQKQNEKDPSLFDKRQVLGWKYFFFCTDILQTFEKKVSSEVTLFAFWWGGYF